MPSRKLMKVPAFSSSSPHPSRSKTEGHKTEQRADWAGALSQPKSLQFVFGFIYSCRHRAVPPSTSGHSPETAKQSIQGKGAALLPGPALPAHAHQARAPHPAPPGGMPSTTPTASCAAARDGATADSDQSTTDPTPPQSPGGSQNFPPRSQGGDKETA